jgi:hypothetical protein
MADYHIRATSRHVPGHHIFFDSGIHHQQGYHRARMAREDGVMNRRLSQDGNTCLDLDSRDQKAEQCLRLATCSLNYNLYDMFVFTFGDDISFDTGSVDAKENIKAEDEASLRQKVRTWSDIRRFCYKVMK